MKRIVTILVASSAIIAATGLTACGKKSSEADTNIVEMNASDGSMNDMTVVESSQLDQAGSDVGGNAVDGGNASNAM